MSTSLHLVLVRQFHFIDPGKHGVEQVKTTVCHNVERIWKCSTFAENFARKQNTAIDVIAFTVYLHLQSDFVVYVEITKPKTSIFTSTTVRTSTIACVRSYAALTFRHMIVVRPFLVTSLHQQSTRCGLKGIISMLF